MFAKALAAAFFVAQRKSNLVSAQTCNRYYTIQEGDICDGISATQGASTYQLAVVNENVINEDCTNLAIGSSICLGWQGEDCSTTYVVQDGDDCDNIEATYGLNSTILYMNNPQINADCTNIYIGEVLCTSSTVQVPAVPSSGSIPATTIPATATAALPWCD